MTTLTRPKGAFQWLKLYRLYHAAFPASERKPFSMILKMCRKGRTDIWCIQEDGRFSGLAMTINSDTTILLDYFAVAKNRRGHGIGSAALRALREATPARGCL